MRMPDGIYKEEGIQLHTGVFDRLLCPSALRLIGYVFPFTYCRTVAHSAVNTSFDKNEISPGLSCSLTQVYKKVHHKKGQVDSWNSEAGLVLGDHRINET